MRRLHARERTCAGCRLHRPRSVPNENTGSCACIIQCILGSRCRSLPSRFRPSVLRGIRIPPPPAPWVSRPPSPFLVPCSLRFSPRVRPVPHSAPSRPVPTPLSGMSGAGTGSEGAEGGQGRRRDEKLLLPNHAHAEPHPNHPQTTPFSGLSLREARRDSASRTHRHARRAHAGTRV